MAEKETKNFASRDKDGNEIGVFTGKQPRQAALKAANPLRYHLSTIFEITRITAKILKRTLD